MLGIYQGAMEICAKEPIQTTPLELLAQQIMTYETIRNAGNSTRRNFFNVCFSTD